MHLTNYAINKNSKDFVRDDEAGSKRSVWSIDAETEHCNSHKNKNYFPIWHNTTKV